MAIMTARAAHIRYLGKLAVLASGVFVGACSGGGLSSPFTTGSPFSSSNTIDRTFIGAAQTWDLDKDASVSCDEWKQYAGNALREADSNGDGALTSDEYGVMANTDRLFTIADLKYYDGNSDGKVTTDELTGKQNRAFNLLDKNSDCRIDRGETVQVVAVEKKKTVEGAPTDAQIERATGRR
jgi:EF hand